MRKAFTLVEMLISIAIIGVLIALTLPAIQKVREAANNAACKNHLKQMGLACHLHHDVLGFFPDLGGEYGDRTTVNGRPTVAPYQQWGWAYQILPYIEQENLWNVADQWEVAHTTVPIYHCPSRADRGLGWWGLAYSDYSANGGQTLWGLDGGALRRRGWWKNDIAKNWPNIDEYTFPQVVAKARQRGPSWPTRFAEFRNGTSNCMLIGDGGRWGARSGFTTDCDTYGWIGYLYVMVYWSDSGLPHRDRLYDAKNPYQDQLFASAHSGGINAVMVDGSVRVVGYGIGTDEFRSLCVRDP